MATKANKAELLKSEQFPRASQYDPQWVLENQMGPNVLWLTEALGEVMALTPGMRVLDMGCGRAVSSIFLAKEFGVQVWAADLWINVTDNWKRVCAAGMQSLVFPIHTEAHAMPFPDDPCAPLRRIRRSRRNSDRARCDLEEFRGLSSGRLGPQRIFGTRVL